MIRHLYSFAMVLAIPLLCLRILLRSLRVPAYRHRICERFALGLPQSDGEQGTLIWVHAVSVGETVASAPLINALLGERQRVLVTTMTPTGSERVRALFGDRVLHCYAPYDIPFLIERFIDRLRPGLLILMETELWPNLLHGCHGSGVRVLLANARLSARSAARYQRFPRTTGRMLACIDCIAAQADADAQRFIQLGAEAGRVHVSGSLKFNVALPKGAIELPPVLESVRTSGRPVLIAASTREREEAKVLQSFMQIIAGKSDCVLLLVPRHPERFEEVARLCREQGFTMQRRSANGTLAPETQVFLGDSMGEMDRYYAVATLAFVGGSLVNTGCQNVLEPATRGLPVLAGPSQYNFAAICTALEEAGALKTVADAGELAAAVLELLGEPERAECMGAAGKALVAANQQALPAHRRLITQLLAEVSVREHAPDG